jgi:hypothetical protein
VPLGDRSHSLFFEKEKTKKDKRNARKESRGMKLFGDPSR